MWATPAENVIWVDLKVDEKPLKMELHTGSAVSIISHELHIWRIQWDTLAENWIVVENFHWGELYSCWSAQAKSWLQRPATITVGSLCHQRQGPVLMSDWLYKIRLNWCAIKSPNVSQTTPPAKERLHIMLERYSDAFEDWTVKSAKTKLTLKEDAQAHFHKAQAVLYALGPKVEEELRRLQNKVIPTNVEWSSEWGTPIVPIPKKDGSVRICGEYKVTVIPELQAEQYPLPRIQDIF